jgi:small-conductance mechanosensitive channel
MPPLLRDIILAAVILALAILLARLSHYALEFASTRLIGRTKTRLDDVLIRSVDFTLSAAIVVAGVELTLAQLNIIPIAWRTNVDRLFFVAYLILVYVTAYRLISGLSRWYCQDIIYKGETIYDDQFLAFFRHIAMIVLTLAAVIIVLDRYNVEVSALVTTLGIGSLAIALAAQATLGDIISGFAIMVDRPYRVGDRIEILEINTWGDVIEIGLRSTRIVTRDSRTIAVPNSVISKGLIVNYSFPDTVYRVETTVSVAYGTDIERARQVMIDAIRAQDWVMQERLIEALFLEFGDSGLIFRVRCWIEHYVETRRIIDKMNSALYHALNREGMIIPYPQRVVHVVSGNGPAEDSFHIPTMRR